ncbi:unnamed protein product [Rhizoctonia solani]|uniref:Uncharacterized protein n=1 Tax=Rhizoctonia solani TaxID=456999 RepID=A0A8H3DQN2_9AGAM|nr:unnamed protein product [Rhizoctonia solani]
MRVNLLASFLLALLPLVPAAATAVKKGDLGARADASGVRAPSDMELVLTTLAIAAPLVESAAPTCAAAVMATTAP